MCYMQAHTHFIHSFILETYIAPLQETTTQRRNYTSFIGENQSAELLIS